MFMGKEGRELAQGHLGTQQENFGLLLTCYLWYPEGCSEEAHFKSLAQLSWKFEPSFLGLESRVPASSEPQTVFQHRDWHVPHPSLQLKAHAAASVKSLSSGMLSIPSPSLVETTSTSQPVGHDPFWGSVDLFTGVT